MTRVLVIDDEELARFALREILESANYEVDEAQNGAEGIKKQNQTPFDLVVTDIIMPVKEGVETTIELKRNFPDIKIIVISGGGRTRNLDFLEMAKKFGADMALAKPFSNDEFLAAVEKTLAV